MAAAVDTLEKKFNITGNRIITSNNPISCKNVETFLKRHMKEFPDGSKFTIFCGMHHSLEEVGGKEEVKVHHFDPNISRQYQSMLKCLQYECKCGKYTANCPKCKNFALCKKKNINFKESEVVELKTEECPESGNFKLKEESVRKIEEQFESLLHTKTPNVIIFGSCYSYRSQINGILRSRGLLSVQAIAQDAGDITCNNVFRLSDDQKEILKVVSGPNPPKDLILFGKNISFLAQFI